MFCPQPLCKVQIRPWSRGTAITNKLDEYNGTCGCLQLNPISCDIRLGGIVTGWYSVTPNTFPIVDPTKWDLLLDPGVLRATHTYGTTGRAPGGLYELIGFDGIVTLLDPQLARFGEIRGPSSRRVVWG